MTSDELGKLVRDAWVDHCFLVGDKEPSHLVPWEELNEKDRETDRVIGERVADAVRKDTMLRVANMIELAGQAAGGDSNPIGKLVVGGIYEEVARAIRTAALTS